MRVLVTGGTGFVGSHVARRLQSDGHQVRLLVRCAKKGRDYYNKLGLALPELVPGDITDEASIHAGLVGCDAVVHAAAGTPLGNSKQRLYDVNVGGTRNVVDAALKQGTHIVCVSSITAIFNEDGAKVTPDASPVPSKLPYGQSKFEAELFIRNLQTKGEPIASVYPGGVVGPDDPGLSDSMRALQHRITNGFRIFGDGGMQQVDVRDLATFISALAENQSIGRFVVPGVYLKWIELADIVEQACGSELQRIHAKGWKLRLIGRMVDFVRKFKTVDSPISAETMRYATRWPEIENSKELSAQGIVLRDPRETFADSIAWLVAEGYLDAERCPAVTQRTE